MYSELRIKNVIILTFQYLCVVGKFKYYLIEMPYTTNCWEKNFGLIEVENVRTSIQIIILPDYGLLDRLGYDYYQVNFN